MTHIQRTFHCNENDPYLISNFDKAVRKGQITEEDKEYIILYIETKLARDNISATRARKISTTLLGWQKTIFDKPYSHLTYPDLLSGMRKLSSAVNQHQKVFSDNTKHDYVVILKPFLIWMVEEEYNSSLKIEKVSQIKNPAPDRETRHPDDILTPDEIVNLISAATNSRDRAIISMQYELGTRIAELGRLTWRDIIPDEYGARVVINDRKTRKKRYSRITRGLAYNYLLAWKNDYPGNPDGDAPVFVALQREKGREITYPLIHSMIQRTAQRAGIEKHITSHLFRASRITHLLEQGLPQIHVVESMWGNQGTNMIKTYVRVAPEELDKALLRHAGVEVDDDSLKARTVEGRVCNKCGKVHSPTARFCMHCGTGLTPEAVQEIDIEVEKFLNHPLVIEERMKGLEEEMKRLKQSGELIGNSE